MVSESLRHAKEALETLDTEKILGAYADTFLFEDMPSAERITDKPALRTYFRTLFSLPSIAFTNISILEAPAFAAIEWSWSGLSRSSGNPFQTGGASIIKLEHGRIVRETLYYDPRPALS